MSNLRNSVQLIGNLGKDPEIKLLENGKKVVRLSVATTDSFKNALGEMVKNTQWHRVVAFGKLADIIDQFLQKGKEVALEGKLVHRSYEDTEGITRYTTEIIANELVMLGKKAATN